MGYAVLVPNPFYRVAKSPVFGDISNFSFSNPTDRAKVQPLMASATAAGGAEQDAAAFVAFLDAQPQVNKARKIGVQGYCMGGPLTIRTMAAVPDRIGAGASFHGGGLVTDQPSSPHLLAPKIRGRVLIAVASNDDARQPTAKDDLKKAFEAAKVTYEIEVYKGLHGWCVPDMPLAEGSRSTTRPTPIARGDGCSRCIRPAWLSVAHQTTRAARSLRVVRPEPRTRGEASYATESLAAFTGRARTILRAGFALNIVGSLVNGLIPLRALVAAFFTTTNLAKPGTRNTPLFFSSL